MSTATNAAPVLTNEVRAVVAECRERVGRLLDESAKEASRPEQAEAISVPRVVLPALAELLEHLERGIEVEVVPRDRELTTQEAADLLGVSRPYFISMLEQGTIPYRRLNSHRRVRASDVLAYRAERDRLRDQALDELAAEAQRLGLGY